MVQSNVSTSFSRKVAKATLLLSLIGTLSLGNARPVLAQARGDDYPYSLIDAVDQWGLYTRQCTSFVAHRLSGVNGFTLPRAYGNADTWGYRAKQEGYRVDKTPAVGAVAWWDSMHVAWVSAVYGDTVEIEEYNYGYRHVYNKRQIPRNAVTGYIHFKDLEDSPTPTPSVAENPPQTEAPSLSPSGTYRFSTQLGVKNEPKQASPDLTYYHAGQTVRYDRVLTADGKVWISYISYAGNRRYIPVQDSPTTPNPTPPPPTRPAPSRPARPQSTLAPSGSYRFTSRSAIRNAPSLSSPEIASYEAGETVRYDRILTAEGRQWLSYISYSGVRRYIALP